MLTASSAGSAVDAIAPFAPQVWSWRGHAIRYVVQGSGSPLVLVHGFGASIGHWRHNIPVLAAAGYRVYALDLLGFGGSAKPALPYTLDLWAELLVDFWQQHIQQPAVFIGNSIGALLSLIMAARHPQLTAGAVLLNCAGGLNHRSHELSPIFRLFMSVFTALAASPVTGPFLFDRVRQRQRIRATLKQVYRNPAAITDELVEILYAPSCDVGAQQVFASILTAPPGPTPEALLPQVRCPLLVLWGEGDPWTPIQRGRGFQNHVKGIDYQFLPIPNTGHCPHDERPEVVNPLILSWLPRAFAAV
ncbi:alpha/beta fold hydrolase [Synechococcus sp. R8-2]|uniref:alpha/beta fold hydrolase n=1 Tax=Synechococcus sp. R8-2 TaxID=2291959 RepID=UPI0039C0F0BF